MASAAQTCGFIYVISHPDMPRGARKIGFSTQHPFDLAARWERLAHTGPHTLRLHSLAFVHDIAETRTCVDAHIAKLGAQDPALKSDDPRWGRLPREAIAETMRHAVAQDHARMAHAFDRHTGLLRTPTARLSGPPARLVNEITAILKPHCRPGDGALFRHPFMAAILWSVLDLRAHQLQIPTLYVSEIYRTLVSRLWHVRPSNTEMRDILASRRRRPADHRLGLYEFTRSVRPPLNRDPSAAASYAYLTDLVADPAGVIADAYDRYAQRHYATWTLKIMAAFHTVIKAGLLAALILIVDSVLLGGAPDNMLRGLIAVFVAGLALMAADFFAPMDTARMLGLIGRREWRQGRAKVAVLKPAAHGAARQAA